MQAPIHARSAPQRWLKSTAPRRPGTRRPTSESDRNCYDSDVAKPIEPTPPLSGDDALALLAELEGGAVPEEMARRVADARRHLAETAAGKPIPLSPRKH